MKNLYEELIKYSKTDYYPFHMPGHKRQTAYRDILTHNTDSACDNEQNELTQIYKLDITEIEGFDNLHHSEGLLLELQKKAAHLYHAEESFFLINGSTAGILSAVSAIAQDRKKLLLARNCHKSAYHAVLINRLDTEYLWPDVIEEFDIQGRITPEQVEKHLVKGEDICGIMITSPTYDGVISNIREIAEIAHDYRIPVIVDEAHGAHFVLSEKAPESAVECGADIVINSVHKTLPAMTQTALLHMQGSLVDREKLRRYLSVYQSSSPSYILMASIDNCMDFIREQGNQCYERLLEFRKEIEESTEKLSRIRLLPAERNIDPGKLVISTKDTGITGQALYERLLQKYHLQMEMAAPTYVLGILTGLDSEEGISRLIDALEETDRDLQYDKPEKTERKDAQKPGRNFYSEFMAPEYDRSIYKAEQSEKEWISLHEAAGRVSGEFIYLYPPGIPFIVPGEKIGKGLLGIIDKAKQKKMSLIGLSKKGELCVLKRDRESVEKPQEKQK